MKKREKTQITEGYIFSKNNFFLRLWLSAKIQIKSFDYYTLTVSKQLIIIIYLITISKGFAKPL